MAPRKASAQRMKVVADEPAPQPRVLVVDDRLANLKVLSGYLSKIDCEVELAGNGLDALAAVEHSAPDVILLDAMMPGLDGFDVCREIKSRPSMRFVPIVMVTALDQTSDRIRALEAGADDFLSKPVDRLELQARVRSLLRVKAMHDQLDDAESAIFALAKAVDAKDNYTEVHTERVSARARRLGELLGLVGNELDDLYRGGMIHDIGKIGVPDKVLHKPGPLNDVEWAIMRKHPAIGEDIARPLRSAANLLGIVRHHHERVDGSGYPDGLEKDRIPLLARIISVSDAFDAMNSDRPYRKSRGAEQALEVLRKGSGSQWDAEVVKAMVHHTSRPESEKTETVAGWR